MGELKNRKQEIFCQEIASGSPQVLAYLTAGFEDTPSARMNASKLRHKPHIAARIAELQTMEVSHSEHALQKIEFIRSKIYPAIDFDPLDIMDPDPVNPRVFRLKPLEKIPRRLRQMISKIKTDQESGEMTEIVFVDKLASAGLLLRSFPGGQSERHEITGPNGSPFTVTIQHWVERLYSPAMLEDADAETLEALSQVQGALRLIADKTSQRAAPEAVEAEFTEVDDDRR